ncbi:unnamed protein product, partial [Brassica oleracea var. botrytis]
FGQIFFCEAWNLSSRTKRGRRSEHSPVSGLGSPVSIRKFIVYYHFLVILNSKIYGYFWLQFKLYTRFRTKRGIYFLITKI